MPSASLTSFHEFDTERLFFSEPYTIYPTDESYTAYQKIYLQVGDHPDRLSDLILNTPSHLMSFGIQEKKDRRTGDVTGYQVPIILWNKKGATEEEKQFTSALQVITEKCKQHIHDNYSADANKLNILSWRSQENGEDYPVLYVKLITNRKTNRIMTLFINEDTNEEIDPMELINKRCLLTAALKIENIYVGDNVSMQVKLYEVLVKFIDKKKKNYYRPTSLLRPKTFISKKQGSGGDTAEGEGDASSGGDAANGAPATESGSEATNNPYSALQEEEENV